MARADATEAATSQASPGLLLLPPVAIDHVLRSASFSSAIAACSCRALRDAWRELTSSNPDFAATALVDRFETADKAAEHLYKPEPDLRRDPLVQRNIAPPATGLLDAVAGPLLPTLLALLENRPPIPTLGYLTATGASDARALALLRHLWSLREGAGREADPAAVTQRSNHNGVEDANQGAPVAGQEHSGENANQAQTGTPPFPPHLVISGAAFAGHEATVVELLRHGADPILKVLPAAVRAGNARLCVALLEGGRMAGAASVWSAAAGGDVLGIRGGPSSFVDSYAASEKATLHVGSIYLRLLPLNFIDPPLGPGGSKDGVGDSGGGGGGDGGSSSGSSGSSRGSDGGTGDVCMERVSARGLLQPADGGWYGGGAGQEQPGLDVAVAMAAARAAAEHAADTALGDSNPLLVESSTAAAAAAAAAATAAALEALTPPDASCGGGSSRSSGGSGDRDGAGNGGGGSSAHMPSHTCAFLSTTNHAAVRQLLLQWRPSDGQAPLPYISAAALPYAAAVGAWPVVSELLRAGADPQYVHAPATLLYLALVQGRGAMAAWLLVRLLEHPAGVWRGVGAVLAASVTRIMGRASPLQLLLRSEPMSTIEKTLVAKGYALANLLFIANTPFMLRPRHWGGISLMYNVLVSWPKFWR